MVGNRLRQHGHTHNIASQQTCPLALKLRDGLKLRKISLLLSLSLENKHEKSSLSCYEKIPMTGRLKQWKFISYSSGDWEVRDQGAGKFSV